MGIVTEHELTKSVIDTKSKVSQYVSKKRREKACLHTNLPNRVVLIGLPSKI